MPLYRVINKGFHGGLVYDPQGKRTTLQTEKPFKKIPSWLVLSKNEPVKEKYPPTAIELRALADEAVKVADDKADIAALEGATSQQKSAATKAASKSAKLVKLAEEVEQQDEQNKIDINEATFIDDKDTTANNVESLG